MIPQIRTQKKFCIDMLYYDSAFAELCDIQRSKTTQQEVGVPLNAKVPLVTVVVTV